MAKQINGTNYGNGQEGVALTATFAAGVLAGDPLTITGEMTFGRGSDGNAFVGICGSNVASRGTVFLKGLYWVKKTSTSIANGWQVLVVDGAGAVKVKGSPVAGDKAVLVLGQDSTNNEVLVLID